MSAFGLSDLLYCCIRMNGGVACMVVVRSRGCGGSLSLRLSFASWFVPINGFVC